MIGNLYSFYSATKQVQTKDTKKINKFSLYFKALVKLIYEHIPILDSFELCENMIISALYACLLT